MFGTPYVGDTPVEKVLLGSDLLWQSTPPAPPAEPVLTLDTGPDSGWFLQSGTGGFDYDSEMSIDGVGSLRVPRPSNGSPHISKLFDPVLIPAGSEFVFHMRSNNWATAGNMFMYVYRVNTASFSNQIRIISVASGSLFTSTPKPDNEWIEVRFRTTDFTYSTNPTNWDLPILKLGFWLNGGGSPDTYVWINRLTVTPVNN